MIRPSPELVAIVTRWNQAVLGRDGDTLRNLLSDDDALRYVGSDETELWSGSVLRSGIADHFREIPDFEQGPQTIEAFENGNTGWALWTGAFTFAGTDTITAQHRITFVFALQAGAWKIVQIHISNPMSNIDKMGVDHHALNALVDAARQGFRLDQRHGTATVMFTDIVNSSPLATALGDSAWSTLIADHFTALRGVIQNNDGQFVKSLGDGTLSSFASARTALTAASGIQRLLASDTTEPRFNLRIGLHTGDVVQTNDDFFGTVVNKSARITTIAGPGEICISDVTCAMVGGTSDFAFSDPETVTLKGFDGPHVIHRLKWRADP